MPQRDKTESGTVAWVDLQVDDLARARKFYGDLLGWSFVGGDDPNTGFYTMAQRNGRNVAGLGQKMPGSPFPTMWTIYIGVDDADATARKVAEAGGKVVFAPMDVMGEGRMAIFADPAGAHFGVWQSKRHKGYQLVDEPGATAWHEVYTRGIAKTRDFYAKVFGLEPKRVDAPEMEYWTFHKGDKTCFGMMEMAGQMPNEIPPHWVVYFSVPDADAAVKKVTELGGKVLEPPFDTQHGRMAPVRDSMGAVFQVVKLAQR